MGNQNKLQINLEDDIYEIIKRLKPRTVKLFVSFAIEEFSKQPEAKLFFKIKEVDKNKIIQKLTKVEEEKKSSSLEEWN